MEHSHPSLRDDLELSHTTPSSAWSARTRLVFRFCFAYLGLYAVATQIAGSLLLPGTGFLGFGSLWPLREVTFWVGERVFQLAPPLVYDGNSRDTEFYWVQASWLFVVALLVTGVWSLLDRRRRDYTSLNQWFRWFLRMGLAAQMIEYGMTKVIPVQFPTPSLVTLVTPTGNVPLQGMLWTAIGAAPGYQMFTGWAELLGGVLLLLPRTTTVGALICLADLLQVFVLNMTYDIGVKQLSFHLILIAMFLLAPPARQLVRFFLGYPAGALAQEGLAGSPLRIPLTVPALLAVYLLTMQATANWRYWSAEGGGSPRSLLYGIWDITELSINGEIRPAQLHDYDRQWRRVLFDEPNRLVFQRIDDSFARYGVSVDAATQTLALTKGDSVSWRSRFTFTRPSEDGLLLEGDMDGHHIRMRLQRVEFDTLRVLNSNFRWLRPVEP